MNKKSELWKKVEEELRFTEFCGYENEFVQIVKALQKVLSICGTEVGRSKLREDIPYLMVSFKNGTEITFTPDLSAPSVETGERE